MEVEFSPFHSFSVECSKILDSIEIELGYEVPEEGL